MFTSERRARGITWDMVVAPADGSGQAREVPNPGGHAFRYVREWLTDDRVILLGDPSAKNLYVADAAGEGEPRLLVDGAPFRILWTAVSPDGRWLAFSSDRSGRPEIYLRAFPDGTGDTLVSGVDGGSQPRWRADGRELFFRTDEGIMSVSVEVDGDELAIDAARYLFQGSYRGGLFGIAGLYGDYDVTPDGERFVMFPGVEEGEGRVVIVTNWFAELERLVPTVR